MAEATEALVCLVGPVNDHPEGHVCCEALPRVQEAELTLHCAIRDLLRNAGEEAQCRGRSCGRRIWWVVHRNGRRTPYDENGTNHFITCPEAASFRRPPPER